MKIKTIFLLLTIFTYNILFSQIKVEIKDLTEFSCSDSVSSFIAVVTNALDATDTIKDADLIWSFGDNTPETNSFGTDTVEHIYIEGGGYLVRVDASKGADTDYAIIQHEIALTPNFYKTTSSKKDSICLGQEILLTGVINDSTWVYEIPNKSEEENPHKIPDANDYIAKFDYRVFEKTEFVTDGSEVDTIMVKLEHNNLADVQVELICPNGSGIILKSFGGQDGIDLGVPNATNPDLAGTAYTYYWTDFGTNTEMNNVTISLPDTIMPEGEYGSESNFNSLAGCPLNGEWKIKVIGDATGSQGYVVASQLTLKGQQVFTDWEYNHTYNQIEWIGESGYVSSTNPAEGTALAIPDIRANIRYTFTAVDNFRCRQDTSLIARVEPVTFTASPDSGDFKLPVLFTPTTNWATEYKWDFGDGNETITEDSITHTYEKDGIYIAILTAIAEDGCSDTASIPITVTIPESSLSEIPNAF
jgi:PKD repeat protein